MVIFYKKILKRFGSKNHESTPISLSSEKTNSESIAVSEKFTEISTNVQVAQGKMTYLKINMEFEILKYLCHFKIS